MTMLPKPTVWRSRKYLDFVKSLNCCACGFPADDPHHEQLEGHGGMGTRPCDSRAIPMCRAHHDMRQHGKHGRLIWLEWGVNPEEVIRQTQAAWLAKGNKALWLA